MMPPLGDSTRNGIPRRFGNQKQKRLEIAFGPQCALDQSKFNCLRSETANKGTNLTAFG